MFKPLVEIFFWVILVTAPDGSIVPVQSPGYYKNMTSCEQAVMKVMDENPQLNIRAGTCLANNRYLALDKTL